MADDYRFFMKPSQSFYDSFAGCDVRWLSEPTGLSRAEFKAECAKIIAEAESKASARGLSEEEVNEVRLNTMRQLGESSLFFFCVSILGLVARDDKTGEIIEGFVDSDYGYRLCLDVQENKWKKLWVLAREHYKSTIITCASTLWEIIRNPNATFCIYSYKEDMAKKFLGQIRGWIEDIPLVRALWPDIFWENPALGYEDLPNGQRKRWAWTSTEIEVKRKVKSKEKTIEVAGIGGNSKTGAHFRYQIFDDAETIGSVGSPEAIDSLYQSVMMAFNTGQTGKLDFCFVGTFYARADVYYRMLKNGIFRQAVIQPCVDKDGKPILFSYEALEEKYRSMGAAVFATQMMCDPSFNSSATFKAEWVRRWSPNPEGLNVYVVVDPASGKTSKKHDFTVMLAFGIDSLGNILVLDMIRDKIGLEQKFISLASFVQRYNPVRIYYEQVSMQQDISSLEMLMDKYHTRFALIPFNPTKWGDKGARIEKLRNKFEYQQVYLPESCVHANFDGTNEDMISTFYYDEYLGYPTVMHDDALDCLSSANLLYTDGELQAPVNQTLSRKIREREALDDDYSPFAYAVRGSYGMFEAEYEDLGEPEPMLPFGRGQRLA